VTIDTLTRLLAPFLPYFSEEVYSYIGNESVHTQAWPEVDESRIDEEAESTGELIKEITASIRRYKSEHGIALNAPLGGIEIYSSLTDASDIAGATNSRITLKTGKPDFEQVPCGLKPDMKVLGKTYRSKAKALVDAMNNAGIMEIVRQAESGSVTLPVDGEDIILDTSCFTIEKEVLLEGKAVDVLEVRDAVIVITR
jgi:valyl-tRNA synthetase